MRWRRFRFRYSEMATQFKMQADRAEMRGKK
jgi:hypothetical protein